MASAYNGAQLAPTQDESPPAGFVLVVLWCFVMKQLGRVAFLALSCAALLPGCDKVQQCNKLINAINAHTPKLTAATEKFGEIEKNPKVVEEYEAVVEAAITDVQGLDLSDEKVAGFAKRYETLLEDAKSIGPQMKEASSDITKMQAVVGKADEIRKTEDTLVGEVNTYCGGQ